MGEWRGGERRVGSHTDDLEDASSSMLGSLKLVRRCEVSFYEDEENEPQTVRQSKSQVALVCFDFRFDFASVRRVDSVDASLVVKVVRKGAVDVIAGGGRGGAATRRCDVGGSRRGRTAVTHRLTQQLTP